MGFLQVTNAVQSGNAALSRQLCECCCENRLAIVEQTNALQAQAAQNAAQGQLQLANHDANVRLQLSQNHSDDRLDVCQQTNALSTQADRNYNGTLGAIAALQTNITKEFCDIREREMQSKIDTQADIITQLRGHVRNDKQTEAIDRRFNALETALATFAAKQPNTVPVVYPNLTAVNNTPYGGGYGYPYGYAYGNGFGPGVVL